MYRNRCFKSFGKAKFNVKAYCCYNFVARSISIASTVAYQSSNGIQLVELRTADGNLGLAVAIVSNVPITTLSVVEARSFDRGLEPKKEQHNNII